MIKFSKITYCNFLSVGDQGNTIDLDNYQNTIITGDNGSGKSTFIDALVYALFGKPFRKVRLGQLLNTVNEKGLVVEILFSVGNKTYMVKRGMKPSVFEVWVDGEMIPQPSETKDYQSILENDILKLNYKSFTQIIVLGSASFKPFMQQKLSVRREIIEDLLDISVFSQMNNILKIKIKEAKTDLIDIEHKLDMTKEQHSSKRNYLLEATEDHKKRIAVVEGNITDTVEMIRLRGIDKDIFEKGISELEDRIDELIDIEEKINKLNDHYSDIDNKLFKENTVLEQWNADNMVIDSTNDKIKDCEALIVGLDENKTDLLKKSKDTQIYIDLYVLDIDSCIIDVNAQMVMLDNGIVAKELSLKFYKENETCPECKQDIESLFRDDVIIDLNDGISKDKELYGQLDKEITKLKIDQNDIIDLKNTLNELSKDIQIIEFDISKWNNSIKIMNESIDILSYHSVDDIKEKEHIIVVLNNEKKEGTEKIGQYNNQYNELISLRKELTDIQKELALAVQSHDSYIKNHESLVDELKGLKETPACSINQDDIDKLAEDIKSIDGSIGKNKHLLHYFGVVQRLLKDDGLKTKIIRKFLPLINANVNMYLDKFNFPINFNFDENFNETIQSQFRSDFSYYSFSEGEKSRIDLALLFAWREVSLKKSRNSSNIIIFDEIFDGSLDVDGIENFMSILGLDGVGYNSFIISHKDETINSRFDRNLHFDRTGHFSKMMEK